MTVDGLSGADVFEFLKHAKGSSGRAQCLEGLVNEVDGLSINSLTRHICI